MVVKTCCLQKEKYQCIILTFKDDFCSLKESIKNTGFFASIIFAKQNETISSYVTQIPGDVLYATVIPGSKGENEKRRMDWTHLD